MKMTLNLPDDLVRELKLRSELERRTLNDVATDALRNGLQIKVPAQTESATEPEGLMLTEDGFPVIQCEPDAPASRMTIEELLALEQESLLEEDLKRAGLAP